ncbi:MAG: hypothetical protein RLZ98_1853 [Pseudomonadota bacterium]|jgi:tripartite-type tricarboxylate transporter receptor subunit TctC
MKAIRQHLSYLALAAALPFAASVNVSPALADPVEDFYKGRKMDLLIGFTAGGGYDVYARMVARHMAKHIPGQPSILPKQMTGAGSRRAVQYLYNVAPKDGSVIATADQSIPLAQAMGDPSIKFDANKLIYIGNPNADNNVISVWTTSGVKTIDDAKAKAVTLGTTGSNTSSQYPLATNALLGTKFNLITGYPGGNDINFAMERGEVDGRGSNAWASWKATRPQWLAENKLNHLVQIGLKKAPDLPDVPLLMDLATNESDKAALRLLSAPTAIGRPIMTTPDVPADRVAALRQAFDKTMKDPDFIADAKKSKLDLEPVSGAELQKIVADIIATPKDIAHRLAVITKQRWVEKKDK